MLSAKAYYQVTGTIFLIIGFVHLLRFFNSWEVVLAGWMVPVWISIVGMVVAWFLAYSAFVLAGKKSKK